MFNKFEKKINIKKIGKFLSIFIIVFIINFFSIFFLWLNRKFGNIDFESLIYHLELIRFGNLVNPDHHLTESFIYYVLKINFILSFLISIFLILLKRLNTYNLVEKQKLSKLIVDISNKIIRTKSVWILLILILFFSAWNSLTKINLSNKIDLRDNFKKINFEDINKNNNKNLILIYTESLDASLKDLNKKNNLPNINVLKEEFLSVEKFVQVKGTGWTIAGIFSTQCGIPLLNQAYLIKKNFFCLPDILKKLDYTNYFLIGHDSKFQNYDHYLLDRYDFIIDQSKIEKNYNYDLEKNYGWGWGYNDNVLFDISKKILKDSKDKFFLTILTSDTHGPMGVKQNDCEYKYITQTLEESIKCFDLKLKNFIDYLIPIYGEDTLIVVVSDHLMMSGMRFYKDYFDKDNERYMTNIFISNELVKKKFYRNIINHFDIFPTTLNLMNVYNNSRLRLGVSILEDTYNDNQAKINNAKFNQLLNTNIQDTNNFD